MVRSILKNCSRDLHHFWYSGHFALQRADFDQTSLAGEAGASCSMRHGVSVHRPPVAQEDLALVRLHTLFMALLLAH